ncbi:MarR family winged helix-turn-helix transcriptional regulator [Myceligenerans crystallogenes]|uniref:MarR family winged helix-turn-helix transcriptional regulator n=1 Tax=Myceligenerans crystallogenes TaxID=316335 RepID=A0ABP4ZEN6_9MICO
METKQDSEESIPPGGPDLVRLLDDLVRVEVRLYTLLDARLRAATGHGIGRLDALRTIAEVPGCRVSDVVRRLGITVGAASKGVDRQVRDGFVRRIPDPEDGRSSFLALTPEGRQVLDDLLPAAAREVGAVVRATGLPDDDVAHLSRILPVLRAALESGPTASATRPSP